MRVFILFIFNQVQGVHRRVTGFCAGRGVSFAQKAGGARVLAVRDQGGAEAAWIAGFGGCENLAKAAPGKGFGKSGAGVARQPWGLKSRVLW